MRLPGSKLKQVMVSFVLCAFMCGGNMAVAQQAPTATHPPDSPSATPVPVPDAPSVQPSKVETSAVKQALPGGAKNNSVDFGHQLFSPWTFILPAVTAGISMETADDRAFDTGARGYGQRYGIFLADNVDAKFMRSFAIPTIFNQVERYHPLGPGNSFGNRFGHAMKHTFFTQTRHGNNTFNLSGVPASFAVAAVGNFYYPGKYNDLMARIDEVAACCQSRSDVDLSEPPTLLK